MENESKLKESLIECDREKEELEMKCTVLEREKVEQSQTTRYTSEILSIHCFLFSKCFCVETEINERFLFFVVVNPSF